MRKRPTTEGEKKEYNAYMRKYRAQRKAKGSPVGRMGGSYNQKVARMYVDRYLSEHPCVDCGFSDPLALEFDHVRGKKSFEISVGIQSGFHITKIIHEIEKCDVRCANCHRIRHKSNG